VLTFAYTAKDPKTGKTVKAQVEAETEAAAAKLIQAEGLAPLDIKSQGGAGDGTVGKFRNRVRTKEKIIFSRQMSTLINAGLPLVQSLRNVNAQTENKTFKGVINEIITDIEGGSAFADALKKHPRVFNHVYVSLIAAGEASGTLDKALERIANQQEKDAEIISKVRGAMAYPAIVLLVMVGVVGFMIVKVLPQVEGIYKGIPGAKLPFITVALLDISHFTIKYWWVVILLIGLAIFSTTRYARTPGGRQVIDKFKMKAWPIGPLFMKLYMARFARTATTLISSGVPLIQMLEIVAESISNVHLEHSSD
jgi:type IV pilus assembly protein PilC